MEIQFYGANCLRITTKKARIVVDDNLQALGGKSITKEDDITLITDPNIIKPPTKSKLTIDSPGEYEVSDVSIQGVATRAHMDEKGKNSIIFKLVTDDVRIAVVGHVYPELSETQLEAIGVVDVLCIPVGGNGYTLDGLGALKLVKKISPKLVVPTHFQDKNLKFEVPQASLDEALHGLAMEAHETLPKLKPKAVEASDITRLIVLEKQ